MTFLNPLVLFGLAAASIPILIHLFNLRKLKTVEFSSLRFLKELQKTTMRRIQVKQWLLLALRTLLIVSLVMAFARPALRGSLAGGFGTYARTTGVAIIDDSPSTGVRNDQGIIFEQARAAAASLGAALKEGDELFVLPLSTVGHGGEFVPVRDAAALGRVLKDLSPTEVTVPYADAVATASRLLSASKNFNHELYLFTDLQGTQFTAGRTDTADLFDDRVRVFVAGPAPGRVENIGIADLRLASRIMAPGRPAVIHSVVRNFGENPLVNGVVSIYLDRTRVVQRSIDLAAHGSAAPAASVIPRRRGVLNGSLRLEDDAFDGDNTWHYVLDVPATVRILLVGARDADARLLRLALAVRTDTTADRTFVVQSIDDTGLSSTDIARFDVIVCSGVQKFSSTDGARLVRFVTDGGGLMLFPGDGTDLANITARLLQPLGVPAVGEISNAGGEDARSAGFSFRKVDYDHPLFAGMFEEGLGSKPSRPSVESPAVMRALLLRPGDRGLSVIDLSNGGSFLTDHRAGAGRLLVFSVAADLAWSDFPLKGLFVPLLHRGVSYLSAGSRSERSFTAGKPLEMTLRLAGSGDPRATYVIISPDGREERVVPHMQPGSGMASFTLERASRTGIYELRRTGGEADGGELLHAAAVNPDPTESDFTPVSDATLEEFWSRLGIRPGQVVRLEAAPGIEQAVQQSRFGVELWKYFLGLAALLALTEMLIGRAPKDHAGH